MKVQQPVQAMLVTPAGRRRSELGVGQQPIGTGVTRSLELVDEVGAFQLGRLKVS
ncbi:hypothetical protein ABT185_27130 [Streptomyces clavifer]|uniref:hypothetical protein n=1 Tax=Streptomyces clavifer TaxID=68188 RepID=UPI00331E9AAA